MDQPMDFRLVDLTLEEAMNMVFSDDLNVDSIYIEPPDVAELTDEDSGEEDNGGKIDNLTGRQLRAKAEIVLHTQPVEDDKENTEEVSTRVNNIEVMKNSITQKKENLTKLDKSKISWMNGDFDLSPSFDSFPKGDYDTFKNCTPVQMFEKLLSDDIIEFILLETKKYALFKNCQDPNISMNEMRCFIAILILSGYNELPGKKFYWDTDSDMKNILVSESMRRDRFITIMRFLHCADNNSLNQADKLSKLRPLMQMLQEKFLQHFVPEQEVNFDESMVKYFGKHSCKQFIRGKPIRFGYKMWCANTKSGYLLNFDMYQGINPKGNAQYEANFGKCAAPFVTMIDELPLEKLNLPYKFFFDNLFTGLDLLHELKKRGYGATGTIRENRIPKSCPLENKKKILKSKKRGDYQSVIDREHGIIFVRWIDNNVVTVASTYAGVQPLSMVKRYSQNEKKVVQVPRPYAITNYNDAMGGTDLMDEHIARFRISIRGKKWWWCIFTWLLDVTIVNAWILHKKAGNNLTQLQFRRDIVRNYLNKFKVPAKVGGRPSKSPSSFTSNRVSDDIRYDGMNHLFTSTPDKKKRRCAAETCKSIIRTMCTKCNVGLCIGCNVVFHSK